MVHGRTRTDDDDAFGIHRGVERRRHGARADAFHERRDGRRVAEPRAVIDVVGLEARAHELLEQVRLFVRPFRRAEARQRLAAALVEDLLEPFGGARQRLFPGRFAEHLEAVRVGLGAVHVPRRVVAADQRLREALRRGDIVVAETAFDAEPVFVRVTVAAVDLHDAVVLHGHCRLAADAAERTQRVDDFVELLHGALRGRLVHQRFLVQRAGRTRLDALAARDAGREAHRIVDVEHGHGVAAAQAHADHVVDLHLTARAHARAARNARIEIHRDRGIGKIELGRFVLAGELGRIALAAGDAHRGRPFPERRLIVGPGFARPHVARQQLEHHLARFHGAR